MALILSNEEFYQIKQLDQWPIVRSAMIERPDLFTPRTSIAVGDSGRTLAILSFVSGSVNGTVVHYLRQVSNQEMERLRCIDELSNKDINEIQLIEGAIFAKTLDLKLYCWHPVANANILFDENNARRKNPFVQDFVKLIAAGFQHICILMLRTPQDDYDRLQVYSFNRLNLIGEPLIGLPTMVETKFKQNIISIACCRYDGSVALFDNNTLLIWGSWNGKLVGEHVNRYFMIPLSRGNYGTFYEVHVSSTDIVLRSTNGNVYTIEYSDPFFTFSAVKLIDTIDTIKSIRSIHCHNASNTFLMVDGEYNIIVHHRIGVKKRKLYKLDKWKYYHYGLPDVYATHVYHSTPLTDKALVDCNPKNFEQLRYLERFNSIHESCMAIDLNGFIFYAHYSTLSKRIYQECRTIRQYAYKRRVFDDLVVSTFISNLNAFETSVSYEFLYYLYTGFLRLDETYWGSLLLLAQKLGCETLEKFIKIENERRNLVRRAKGLQLIELNENGYIEKPAD